jgi:serine/threonine protein kinase
MTPERYQKIAELYQAAQELEPERRSDYLLQACEGDEDLHGEVKRLLVAHKEADNFLDTPAFAVAAEALVGEESDSLVGKRLGRFEILSLLGAGGMGEVYLAEDAQLGRRVALKLLPKAFTEKTDRLRRFEREARAASALNHPNIITIHDIGEAEGIHYIATEYIEGDMLRRRIAHGRLPLGEAVEVALQVAGALDIAHSAGIIHRDIKPENIMLRPDGYVKVLDFGLAKLTEPKMSKPTAESEVDTLPISNETTAGMIIGTVNYMSPEQARGLRVDHRSDLWSLGVTLYEMVVGKSPFTGETATDVIVSIIDRTPQPLAKLIPDLPDELERIVMKALAKDRDARYQSAKDMAIDLKNLKRQLEMQVDLAQTSRIEVESTDTNESGQASIAAADENVTPVKKAMLSPARMTIAALLLVIVGLVAWLIFRPQPTAPISAPVTTSTTAPAVPAAPKRQISYSLSIQKMLVGSDGNLIIGQDKKPKPDGAPYDAWEADTFASTDRFSFQFSSPQEGYLYLLNGDDQSYSMLFPTPSLNNSSAKVSANQAVPTGRFLFETSKPVEQLWLVWSSRQVDELEAVKKWVNPQDLGEIKSPRQLVAVKQFLEKYKQPTPEAVPDEAAKQTTVGGSGEVLIHLIKLTHN